MQEFKIVLTWEAIYDITDLTEYIEANFGRFRADRFQDELKAELKKLEYMGSSFPKTQLLYRNYHIHKKPFPPSVIFYVLMKDTQEVHVLRVLREERDWKKVLERQNNYTYPN